MSKTLVHSAPGASGNALCGLPHDCKMNRTCHLPSDDVLEAYQTWCGFCKKEAKMRKLLKKDGRIFTLDGRDVTDTL